METETETEKYKKLKQKNLQKLKLKNISQLKSHWQLVMFSSQCMPHTAALKVKGQ